MAHTIRNLHHEYEPSVEKKPKNPVYETRMYVSGFLGFIGTTYKKEMISCDGYEEVWTCGICGLESESEYHQPKIMRTDRVNNNE